MILFMNSCVDSSRTSGNPIFPGWYSDPEAVIWEGEYWVFPTASLPFEEQTYMDAFSSKDLVNWTKHEHIVDTTEVKWIWQAMWSPAVIEKDGYYYLFICGNDMYADGDGGIGYVRADKPGGPYKDILGRPLLDKIINGAQPIDQYIFRDDDGTFYMTQVEKMIGGETKWAEKKRLYREKKDNVLLVSSTCPNNVRQEIETDTEKETKKDIYIAT